MKQSKRTHADSAFTLVETMIVVAIIGLLAAVAMLSYSHFTKKSQAVEADIALAEVTRLEEVFFSATGTYSSDLDAIGFTPNPPLQYYRVSVQAVNSLDGHMFQVTVNPLSGNDAGPTRSATRYADNQGGERKSGDGGVTGGQARTSTATPAGNAGSGASVGGGVTDELREQMGRSGSQARQDGKVVEHGKPTGPSAVSK